MTRGMDPAVHIALRAALALLFGWAASHKLRAGTRFRATLARYELLPARGVGTAAALVIAGEVGIAAGLCVASSGTLAAVAAAGLLAIYAGAIAVNLARGRRDIDCGCGGAASHQPLSTALVVRNAVLAAAAVATTVPTGARALTWIDGLTIAAGVGALALLYAAVDGVLANAPRSAALAQRRAGAAAGHVHEPEVVHA